MSHSNSEDDTKPAISENTPLLGTSTQEPIAPANDTEILNHESAQNGAHQTHHEKPLPKLQIFILCYARLIEPIAFFGIFPFISEMIYKTGNLKQADVGFYAGLIESMFSFTQMVLMIQWGRAADRIGRKPVLVFSLAGVAIATATFGLSKTIWQMILFRCCAGVFAGTVVTVRTMITENSTPRTQARAFSFFAFSSNVGIFLGPMLGGALSDPAKQIGGIFKRIEFFKEYPYALPTFVSGAFGASAAILCVLFLKETLKRKVKGDESPTEAPMSTLELIKAPGVAMVLLLYGHVMLLGLAYTAVTPVFWFTEPALGGYGLTPQQISFFIGGIGVSQAIWLLFAFPILQRRYGTGGVLRGCLFMWPIFFAAAPVCNYFLRQGWTTAFWITAPVLQIGGSGVAMGFTGVQLALNDISPSPSTLGTLNGVALTMTAGIRTVGPALFTSLFAAGARTQFLNGYLVWVVLVTIAALGSVAVRYLPEKAEGKLKDDDEGEDEGVVR
ncbi:MFS general substrate transporter [Hyaloscypha variabilis F]|uniref:MFS general substrate transporter n=1 Tax=Hyaloscypha variabilis (strain UAMH 11265 / GT02V1 / F) TaxID=1149755 RepID=A0A2J6QVY6_HYAVF|nr:MFS general substrate transporter [Hyaloscypha variabilis F]